MITFLSVAGFVIGWLIGRSGGPLGPPAYLPTIADTTPPTMAEITTGSPR